MTDLTTVLRQSLPDDEPPLGFGADDVVRRGRRARHRRTALVTGTACAVVAATALGVSALRGPGPTSGLTPTATESSAPHVDEMPLPEQVTKDDLAWVTSRLLGVTFPVVEVRDDLPPTAFGGNEWFSISGTVHDEQGSGSVTVAVTEPAALTYPATCPAADEWPEDGYVGPCAVRTLADGSSLMERSGRVPGKEFTMTMAVLVRPDGSGVLSQSTNQAPPGPQPREGSVAPSPPPVTRAEPPVTSAQLARLVVELHPRTRYPE